MSKYVREREREKERERERLETQYNYIESSKRETTGKEKNSKMCKKDTRRQHH